MREEILITILNMTFTGSVVALVIMAARLLIRRLPGKYAYILWAAVGIRLLCPVVMETNFSAFFVHPEPIAQHIVYEQKPAVDSGVFFLDEPVNQMLGQMSAPDLTASVNPIQIWIALGTALWAAGCVLFITINFLRYAGLKRRLKTAILSTKQEKGPRVYESDMISSPIAAGFLRPSVYIPFGMNEEEKEYVVLHECVHIRRKDHIVKLAAFLALAVHWFNPIVWLSYCLMCEDMERSCDEKVLDLKGDHAGTAYSAILLKFAVKQNRLLLPLAFGESHTKIRVKNILRYRKPTGRIGAILTVAAVLAGCTLSTNPKESGEVSIIGGADGPTSIFIAGKFDPDERTVDCPPVNLEELANETLDPDRKNLHLDYASRVQGMLVFHGPWGILVYENKQGKWTMTHSIDMEKVDDSYMAEGKDTRVLASSGGILIGNKIDGGWEGEPYYYDFETGELLRDEAFGSLMDILPDEGRIGPDQKISIINNEEVKEKGNPYDYGLYQMEENHLAMLNSYTNRVTDLWFADVNSETQSMTQAYLFHGDGEETVYQEEIRQFLFYRNGYDYYVSVPTETLEFEKNDSGEDGWHIPGRRELIRVDSRGKRELLDPLMISWESSETLKTPVIMAGDRLIYRGAEKADTIYFKTESLISIALDGSDRQTAGRDRVPYSTWKGLSLDTSNNQLYFEGWTNDGAFPRPIYRADTRLQNIEKIGEIDGTLITVRDGNFYFLHKDEQKQAIAVARMEEGEGYYFYDKCGYNASEYACEKAYIADGEIHVTFISLSEPDKKAEYRLRCEDTEKAD
ncbi:M56 family metallopeptidase [Clostridium sp. AM58-1XD]|uniref:M56 family metallopeptidase n=1 Tax=Clostridium sp. AM58-1XD TaxID=2292307 RepID=UPI000E493AC5|nr:M56 family metallopeptidase [Clostridium sp. AM58-1XD]RGY99281.1 hypothetical protein DXA13_08665 [Clostridium sp. AM58-1XD]